MVPVELIAISDGNRNDAALPTPSMKPDATPVNDPPPANRETLPILIRRGNIALN